MRSCVATDGKEGRSVEKKGLAMDPWRVSNEGEMAGGLERKFTRTGCYAEGRVFL